MCVGGCVYACVCVCVCVCVYAKREMAFGGGRSNFSAGGGGVLSTPPGRKNSAIPETKLGHPTKTQQNYNRLNYKINYKSVIIHKNGI